MDDSDDALTTVAHRRASVGRTPAGQLVTDAPTSGLQMRQSVNVAHRRQALHSRWRAAIALGGPREQSVAGTVVIDTELLDHPQIAR